MSKKKYASSWLYTASNGLLYSIWQANGFWVVYDRVLNAVRQFPYKSSDFVTKQLLSDYIEINFIEH